MKVKVAAKNRQIILAGFGLIAVLALLYVLFGEQLHMENYVDTLDEKKLELRQTMGRLDLEGPLLVQLDQYKARLQQDRDRLLEADNTNVAESELVKILDDLAERSGVEITSRRIAPGGKPENSLYKVSAIIQARCDPEKLVQFLTEIRNYGRFLTVSDLVIQSRTIRQQTSFTQTLTVSGYVRIAESAGEEENPDV